jgi:predicted Kef-type K+ transport protein
MWLLVSLPHTLPICLPCRQIFAATTLFLVLGTSVLTSLAGLSLALGAFLAGLLIAETEYALQVGAAASSCAWDAAARPDRFGIGVL